MVIYWRRNQMLRQSFAAADFMIERRRATGVVAARIGASCSQIDDETLVDLPEGWTLERFAAEVEREEEHARFLRRNAAGRPPGSFDTD